MPWRSRGRRRVSEEYIPQFMDAVVVADDSIADGLERDPCAEARHDEKTRVHTTLSVEELLASAWGVEVFLKERTVGGWTQRLCFRVDAIHKRRDLFGGRSRDRIIVPDAIALWDRGVDAEIARSPVRPAFQMRVHVEHDARASFIVSPHVRDREVAHLRTHTRRRG